MNSILSRVFLLPGYPRDDMSVPLEEHTSPFFLPSLPLPTLEPSLVYSSIQMLVEEVTCVFNVGAVQRPQLSVTDLAESEIIFFHFRYSFADRRLY